MMARRGMLGLFVGGVAALLSGCGLFGGNSYRFKMTVDVETPEGLRSGSSVYEVKGIGTRDLITGGKGTRTELRGEAVAVDLPGGKTLFALIKTVRKDLAVMSMATLDPAFRNNKVESAHRISSGDGIESPEDVTPLDYPLLVSFKNIADPKSAERVDPINLVASFGVGYALRKITVEVTNERVTNRIEQRLPLPFWQAWSQIHKQEMSRNGGVMKNQYFTSLAGELRKDDFITGAAQ